MTATELRETTEDLMPLLRHIHTPWTLSREVIEVVRPTRRRSTPPVNLEAAGLELRCARTLCAIVSDVTLAINGVEVGAHRHSRTSVLCGLTLMLIPSRLV